MESFTKELLDKLVQSMEPTLVNFDHEVIDKYVSVGGDIKNSVIVTSFPEIGDMNHVRTKHGIIGINFSPYLPEKTMIIINKGSWERETWEL